jgi:catalase (peroxidase I)
MMGDQSRSKRGQWDGIFTDRPGALTNDFFVNPTDMATT